MVHLVVMEIRAAASARRGDALGKHLEQRHQNRADPESRNGYAGASARTDRPRPILASRRAATICCARISSGAAGISRRSNSPRANGTNQRGALDQFIAGGREQASFRQAHPPSGPRARRVASATAMERGDPIWQTRSTVPISMPKFQRSGRHHRPQLAVLQPLFRFQPQRARQAAMMRQNRIGAQPFAQMMRDPLGQPSRIHEHQVVRFSRISSASAVVDLAPHFVAGHRAQFVARNLHRQIHGAPVHPLARSRAFGLRNCALHPRSD